MHISLDAALQRQPLLSTVGDKLLPTFPGAAAAYSLRALNGDANNVVRVRRSGDADGNTNEEDFTAEGVALELEDWVNGKLETTLPCDVATPAAAYSLRKVRNDYTGNAVHIRRASDDVEVNVAFDSNDEVSTSSAISNVTESPDAGDTTANTLGEFLTEGGNQDATVVTWYDQAATIYPIPALSAPQQNVSNQYETYTDASSTGVTAGNTAGTAFAGFNFSGSNGDTVVIEFDFTINSGSPSPNFQLKGSNYSVGKSNNQVISSTGSYQIQFDAYADFDSIGFSEGDIGEFTISNFRVLKFYNGNDATQPTTGNQPLIAENGSLLADGINFESGVNLPLSGSGLDIFKDVGYGQIFSVIKPRETGTGFARYFEATIGTGSGARFLFGDGQDAAAAFRIGGRSLDGDSFGDEDSPTSHNNELSLITGFLNYTDAEGFAFLNGTQVATNSIPNITAGNTSDTSSQNVAIGSYIASLTAEFNAKEFIIYSSDQSDNRFKIESNINNYYGIYNDANEFDASETSFRFLNERVGGTSTSSDLTGFTLDVQTASAYAGAKFSNNVAIGDSIYVSFDCSFDSGSPSPKVGLRNVDSSLTGDHFTALNSNEGLIVEGFNSFVLTSTRDSASGIVWSEGDDNVIFTISNLKVSRVSRDGFVETWYDQSGNSRHAEQLNTELQPQIVKAGSLLADGIDFDGTNHKLDIDGYAALSLVYSSFVVASLDEAAASSIKTIFDSSDTSNGGFAIIHGNTAKKFTPFWFDGNDTTVNVFGSGSDLTTTEALYSTIMKTGASTVHIDGTLDQTLTNTWTLAGSNNFSKSTIGYDQSTPSREFNGKIQEIIIYESDQSANRTAIESNIADEYGITLS